jgi:hypothetical protein
LTSFALLLQSADREICCGHAVQVGTHAKDIQEAQGMIIPVLMPLMLFSGFFLPYEEIPFFFRWLYEISFLRYAFNVLKMNQWQDVTFDDCSPEGDVALCQVPTLSINTLTSSFLNLIFHFHFTYFLQVSFSHHHENILLEMRIPAATLHVRIPYPSIPLFAPLWHQQSACYVNGEAYLEATGSADLSIATNFLVLLGFMAAGAIFSFVSMRAAIHKKAKQG